MKVSEQLKKPSIQPKIKNTLKGRERTREVNKTEKVFRKQENNNLDIQNDQKSKKNKNSFFQNMQKHDNV